MCFARASACRPAGRVLIWQGCCLDRWGKSEQPVSSLAPSRLWHILFRWPCAESGYALPGVEQTNQRAELHAVIIALEGETHPVAIRTDSQYVFSGALSHKQWCRLGWTGDNAVLWHVLNCMLERRGGDVKFVKGAGNAAAQDVETGQVLPLNKQGNDSVDVLAREGAEEHAVPIDVVQEYTDRRERAKAVQRMMPRILEKRKVAEEQLGLPC